MDRALSLKLLYLGLREFDFRILVSEPAAIFAGLSGMFYRMRTQRPLPSGLSPKIQLKLRTPDGGGWDLTLSVGMERFIGHYSRVPGLSSDSPLLEYQPVGCARSG
jgi:hypothetical protein